MEPEVNIVKDVSTVVSLLPYDLPVNISTVFPSSYLIPKAEGGDFSLIYVTRGRTDMYVDSDRGYFSRPVLSEEIANAIARDHVSSQICVVRGQAEPGIFAMLGRISEVAIRLSEELKRAKELHKNWYIRIVEQADSDFKRTGSTRAVGNLARYAVEALNLRREWYTDQVVQNTPIIKCPMCTSMVHPDAILCMTCKYILNPEKYNEMKSRMVSQ